MSGEKNDTPDYTPSNQELEKRLLNNNPQVFDGLSDDRKKKLLML